jgi:hypothetical protein
VPLVLSAVAHSSDERNPSDMLTQGGHVSWKGVKVLVVKRWEQRKGEPAVIDEVLCNQDTPSGLKILVQFINYNPSMPMQKGLYDYDDIVEFTYVS